MILAFTSAETKRQPAGILLAFSSSVVDKPGTMSDIVDTAPLGWVAHGESLAQALQMMNVQAGVGAL